MKFNQFIITLADDAVRHGATFVPITSSVMGEVPEQGVAVKRFFWTVQYGHEIDAIYFFIVVGITLSSACGEDRRVVVNRVDGVIRYLALWNDTRKADDRRHANSPFIIGAFAAFESDHLGHGKVTAVVWGKNYHRLFCQIQLFQLVYYLSDTYIHAVNHGCVTMVLLDLVFIFQFVKLVA